MTEETNESLKKPLDKMTVKELREVALDLPEITGVHGMNKAELLAEIKEAKGITHEHPTWSSDAIRAIGEVLRHLERKGPAAITRCGRRHRSFPQARPRPGRNCRERVDMPTRP